MTDTRLVALTFAERSLLLDTVARRLGEPHSDRTLANIAAKLESVETPQITVGVYGGQVQWVSGNPVPIRICDYDGENDELPDRDDEGLPCRIWLEGQATS